MFKKILLLGFLTIMFLVIVVFAYEDKFPRVAYSPPYRTSDSTYNQYFAQAVDTLHFTGLIQNAPPFKDADFYDAKSCSLNLVNSGLTYYASSGQYSMYQADRYNSDDWFQPYIADQTIRFLSTKYNNVGHGTQVGDLAANNGYAWYVSKDNPNNNRGYVLDSLWNEKNSLGTYAIDYSREQERDSGLTYNVIFKLKVPSVSVYDSVANLEVHFYKHGTTDSILAQRLLLYPDFHDSTGIYNSYQLTFARPPYNARDSFDYKVYWYKQTDLYIDYVEVYDAVYDLLFNVKTCDTCSLTVLESLLINDPAIKDIEQGYKGTSLYRWLLTDEPTYDQYKSSRKVIEILADNVHKPTAYATGIQTTGDFDNHNSYRYMEEVNSHELWYDDYPTFYLPEGNNDTFQLALDMYVDRLRKVKDAVDTKGKEWWYVAPTFELSRGDTIIFRYPHNNELRSFINLALAYGAKGIGYFQYADRSYSDSSHGGLVSATGVPIQTYTYPENAYYSYLKPETLFSEVKQINVKLDTLGPILKKLEWRWAGPSDSAGSNVDPTSFILSIGGDSCKFCGYVCKYPIYQNYIQVGKFRDDSLGEDYLMLVNRWVGYDDKPCERVVPNRHRISYVYDCLTNQLLDTLAIVDTFHVLLFPGEVKFLRFANFLPPANLHGSVQRTNPQRINIYWTDTNANELGYEISRKDATNNSWSIKDSVGSNITSWTDTDLKGSEYYTYKVRAFDESYVSEYSNNSVIKSIPNPPRNLTAHLTRICCPGRGSGGGAGTNGICPYCWTNEVILSWQQPYNQKISALRYYRAKAWRNSWRAYQTISSDYTSMAFCVPLSSVPDTFVVYAIDNAGDSSLFSDTVRITPGTTDYCGSGGGEPQAKIIAQVLPKEYELSQNYPNPCNAGTQIRYALPQASDVRLVIYNILGQKVRVLVEDLQEPGYYTVSWDGRNNKGETVGSGIYFYRIQAGSFIKTAKMSLLK